MNKNQLLKKVKELEFVVDSLNVEIISQNKRINECKFILEEYKRHINNLKSKVKEHDKNYIKNGEFPEKGDLIFSDGAAYLVNHDDKMTNLLTNAIQSVFILEWWGYCE